MCQEMEKFLQHCQESICEASEIPADFADDKRLSELESALSALYSACEHHLGGAKQARLRFAAST